MIIGAYEAWVAAPTPIKGSENLNALMTGLVHGEDNGVIDYIGAGYAEAQGHYIPLNYLRSGVGIWASPPKVGGPVGRPAGLGP